MTDETEGKCLVKISNKICIMTEDGKQYANPKPSEFGYNCLYCSFYGLCGTIDALLSLTR